MEELIALLNVVVALVPEVAAAIPVVEKLVQGNALTPDDVATLVSTRKLLEAKAFPSA